MTNMSENKRPTPQAGILDIAPYLPGKSGAPGSHAIKLSANESPLGASPKAIEAFAAMADKLAIYATALSVEMALYTALASLMALPWLRRRYYGSKFGIDRGAAALIGLLGLSLILRL